MSSVLSSASSSMAVPLPGTLAAQERVDREKVLPLPGWLTKAYFIFPVVLYIPDAIFNYYVYSDGWNTSDASPLVQIAKVVLVSFLSIGVVGMAYLLSVIAPWHWGQGHHIQAFFCGLGVLVATGITTWNSLAYRSNAFVEFKTDQWAYNLWPQLQDNHVSITMILVSIAPPFWGLFWAIVQPTETGRSLRQLQESHEEKLLRVQHEAEVKRLKAEANAKVREAQLRGMAQSARVARDQVGTVLNRKKETADEAKVEDSSQTAAMPAVAPTAKSTRKARKAVAIPDEVMDSDERGMTRPSDSDPAIEVAGDGSLPAYASYDPEGAHGEELVRGVSGGTDSFLSGSYLTPLQSRPTVTGRGDRRRSQQQSLSRWTTPGQSDESKQPEPVRAASRS